jgi:hypothetical protein
MGSSFNSDFKVRLMSSSDNPNILKMDSIILKEDSSISKVLGRKRGRAWIKDSAYLAL